MNLTANRASDTGPEDSKLSWDWTALDRVSPIERAASTNTAVSGRKRHIEGFGTDGTSSSSHKRFKDDATTHAQLGNPVPSKQSTMRASASSLTRPKHQSSLDYNLSKARTAKPKSQAPSHFKTHGPFIIDSDDSDDEVAAPIIPARRHDPPVARPLPNIPSVGPSDNLKITQRIESQRRREEAKRRHGDSFTSSSTLGRSEDAKPQAPDRDPDQTAIDGNAETDDDSSRLVTFAKSLTSGVGGSHANPPTSSSFIPLIKSESRALPAHVRERVPVSGVVDLTGDDSEDDNEEPQKPPKVSRSNEAHPAHDRSLPLSRDSAQVELRNVRARQHVEETKREDEEREAEEAASKAKAAGLRHQAQQRQQQHHHWEAAELARLQKEKRAKDQQHERQRRAAELARHQHNEKQRAREQHRLDVECLGRERALKRPEHTQLSLGHDHQSYVPKQQPERQVSVPHQQQHDCGALRRFQDQFRERELAEKREIDQRERELKEARERQQRERELREQQERQRQEQIAKEQVRRRQERSAKEQERQHRERELADEREKQQQRDLAEQRDMQMRMVAFEKAKAEAEQNQAEKKLQDQLSLEHGRRTGFVVKPVAELQREQQLEMNRNARIQKQQERNAQNRMREEKDARAQQQAQAPAPQSLSSLAKSQSRPTPRREPLAADNRSGTVLTSQTHEQPPQTEDIFRKIRLGEITYEDTQLLKWKDESDHSWAIIRQNFTSLLHSPRAAKTLRLRYNDVTALLKQAGVSPDTMSNLYEGGEDVLRDVNRMVDDFRFTPLYAETKARRRQQQDALRQQNPLPQQSATAAPKKGLSLMDKPRPKPSSAFTFTGLRDAVAQPLGTPRHGFTDLAAPVPGPPVPRPTTGGKTLDEAFFYKMLEDQAQVWHEMAEEDEESMEEEEIGEADYVYWVYVVRRRQWLSEDLERCENDNEEEPEWIECDGEYQEVGLANTAASDEVMLGDRTVILNSESGFVLHCKVGDDNMKSFTMVADTGKVETAVARRLRTYADRIPPQSRQMWRPTTVYQIMQRVTKKVVDEVLDETKEESEEKPMSSCVYFALEQANEVAAQHFVKLTFTSGCRHHTVRTVEMGEQVKAIVERLDDADQLVLEGVGGQDREAKNAEVKVWVVELQALGPRN